MKAKGKYATENLKSTGTRNAIDLEKELNWFQSVLTLRGKITFEESAEESDLQKLALPDLSRSTGNYAQLVQKHQMGLEERLLLILALIPHIKPASLDILHIKNQSFDTPFTEFGGIKSEKHKGFLPTGETAAFLLAGTNIKKRFEVMELFRPNHFLFKDKILFLDKALPSEPYLSGQLRISSEYLLLLTTGEKYRPDFDVNFPAKRITSVHQDNQGS